jgi:outer membrane receptor protein involved in Fe transport
LNKQSRKHRIHSSNIVRHDRRVASRSLISCAVSAILTVHAGVPAYAETADAASASRAADEIGEITVTAQRREEDIQSVPVTIQVLTGETIGQLNVATLDDFLRYLPNVTAAGAGPGQNNIFMRGLSTGEPESSGFGRRRQLSERGGLSR